MASKSDFTTDEWNMLLASPMFAGMAVTLAEPSGLIGMLQEGWASARSILDPKTNPSAGSLAKSISDDLATSDGRTTAQSILKSRLTAKTAGELKAQVISTLQEIADLIDRKAGAEATSMKTWLSHTAQSVAEASKEGGFLGFGGVSVSEAEKATLEDISKALRI